VWLAALMIKSQKQYYKGILKSFYSAVHLLRQERLRISMDLHDELAPQLMLSFRLIERSFLDGKDPNAYLLPAMDHILKVSHRLRSITENLQDELITDVGLEQSLLKLIRENELVNGIGIELEYNVQVLLGDEITIAVFIIFQELINNTIRHSKANHARITINSVKSKLLCVYSDNGSFTISGELTEGTGLKSIAQRVMSIGGTCRLQTDGGVVCYFEIPVQNK